MLGVPDVRLRLRDTDTTAPWISNVLVSRTGPLMCEFKTAAFPVSAGL